jgi:hypothetical protein
VPLVVAVLPPVKALEAVLQLKVYQLVAPTPKFVWAEMASITAFTISQAHIVMAKPAALAVMQLLAALIIVAEPEEMIYSIPPITIPNIAKARTILLAQSTRFLNPVMRWHKVQGLVLPLPQGTMAA